MFDADDRQVLGAALVIGVGLFVLLIAFAAGLGLAWNVLEFMRGL